jgi:hypothetical protein
VLKDPSQDSYSSDGYLLRIAGLTYFRTSVSVLLMMFHHGDLGDQAPEKPSENYPRNFGLHRQLYGGGLNIVGLLIYFLF